jgi:hypothetical protein
MDNSLQPVDQWKRSVTDIGSRHPPSVALGSENAKAALPCQIVPMGCCNITRQPVWDASDPLTQLIGIWRTITTRQANTNAAQNNLGNLG